MTEELGMKAVCDSGLKAFPRFLPIPLIDAQKSRAACIRLVKGYQYHCPSGLCAASSHALGMHTDEEQRQEVVVPVVCRRHGTG